jgi:hypothetical protein
VQSRRAPALINTCHDCARFAPHVGANDDDVLFVLPETTNNDDDNFYLFLQKQQPSMRGNALVLKNTRRKCPENQHGETPVMVLGHPSRYPSRIALSTPLITSSRISAQPAIRHRGRGRAGRERHDVEADDDEGGSRVQPTKACVRW